MKIILLLLPAKINEKYKGVVTRVESYGAFVTMQSVNKTALAHASECSDEHINDLKKHYAIGDLDKVCEIGRMFRNEGISTRHNPEFTSIDLCWSHKDYYDKME